MKVEGKLVAYDEHINLMLEDVGIVRDRGQPDKVEEKKLMYLRGDTVLAVGTK